MVKEYFIVKNEIWYKCFSKIKIICINKIKKKIIN